MYAIRSYYGMEVVSRDPLVIVDFAHTDDGMYQVLESIKDRDISVVFGAGGNRDKLKRPRMGAVAGKFAKKIYVTSRITSYNVCYTKLLRLLWSRNWYKTTYGT